MGQLQLSLLPPQRVAAPWASLIHGTSPPQGPNKKAALAVTLGGVVQLPLLALYQRYQSRARIVWMMITGIGVSRALSREIVCHVHIVDDAHHTCIKKVSERDNVTNVSFPRHAPLLSFLFKSSILFAVFPILNYQTCLPPRHVPPFLTCPAAASTQLPPVPCSHPASVQRWPDGTDDLPRRVPEPLLPAAVSATCAGAGDTRPVAIRRPAASPWQPVGDCAPLSVASGRLYVW